MTVRIVTGVFLTLGVAVVVSGCGKSEEGTPTVGVSGTVTLDGEPLEGAEVHFLAENFASTGMTGADGRYELVQGAPPGENTVYIRKPMPGSELAGDPVETGLDELQMQLGEEGVSDEPATVGAPPADDQIPPRFSDPEKTTLTYQVPEGGTDNADFRLQSE